MASRDGQRRRALADPQFMADGISCSSNHFAESIVVIDAAAEGTDVKVLLNEQRVRDYPQNDRPLILL